MKRKQRILAILSVTIFYIVLVVLLFRFETMNSNAKIRTVGDAIWYSIVTLTTVGYGDVTPITPQGRAIGVIFLILSTGILVTLIGTVFSFLAGEALPLLFLGFNKEKNWYYFADFTSESDTLAQDILKEDSNAMIIYGIRKEEEMETPDYPCWFLNASPARIVSRKKNYGDKCTFFFMKENDIGANMKAVGIYRLPVNVYARTTSGRESMSGNIHFFHSYDCCARSYWRTNPLSPEEKSIVLIGFGHYGEALLERAILTNIISSTQSVSYHIFGDATRFLQLHPNLEAIFSINQNAHGRDSLHFHSESWTVNHDILAYADRIIICDDDEETGWDILWQLQRYYVIRGKINIRSNRQAPGVDYFGTNEEIFTANQIIRTRLNTAAVAMNNLYRRGVHGQTLSWKDLDDLLRQSKIAAADHLFIKLRLLLPEEGNINLNQDSCLMAYNSYRVKKLDNEVLDELRRIEHNRWMRFYIYYNWSYGPVRDDVLRQHPMIRPYDELTPQQKAHHDFAWELLNEIAYHL